MVARGTDTHAGTFDKGRFASTRDGPAIADAGRTSKGMRLRVEGADEFGFIHSTWDGTSEGAVIATVDVADVSSWHLLCARRSAATGLRLDAFWNDGTPQTASGSIAWAAPDLSAQPLLIGNSTALNAGSNDVAMMMVFQNAISNADMALLVTHLRGDFARNGVRF